MRNKKTLKKPLDEETKKALDSIEIDREALKKEEIDKLPKLEKSEALVQTHTGKLKIITITFFSQFKLLT